MCALVSVLFQRLFVAAHEACNHLFSSSISKILLVGIKNYLQVLILRDEGGNDVCVCVCERERERERERRRRRRRRRNRINERGITFSRYQFIQAIPTTIMVF